MYIYDALDAYVLIILFHHLAATKMNRESSRSHAVFTIVIERSEQTPDGNFSAKIVVLFLVSLFGACKKLCSPLTCLKLKGEESVTIGRLNLVDLAGSERIRKTGVSVLLFLLFLVLNHVAFR